MAQTGCSRHTVGVPVRSESLWRALNHRRRLFLIAGPCVLESEALCLRIGLRLKQITQRLEMPFVFKASYDKANRSSGKSFRGPGLGEGLRVLGRLRDRLGVPSVNRCSHCGGGGRSRGSL